MSNSSSKLGLAVLVLSAALSCTNETTFYEQTRIDSFQQERRNAVDLLIVIDNSCSMVEEQDNLAQNFSALIDTFAAADVDWRLAVTTTDVETDRYRGLLMAGDDEVILRWPFSPLPDADSDGLSDADEATQGTSLLDSDSDDDGVIDGVEVHVDSTDPNDETDFVADAVDSDSDGLSDAAENLIGSDPDDDDTNDNGTLDGDEVAANNDPSPRGELDRVAYDRDWPFEKGYSLMLDGEKWRSTFNDNSANFCTSDTEFDTGSFGTPGERNPSCATGAQVEPENTGDDEGPRVPRPGDVFVTEIMAQSGGLDSNCEWVELGSRSADTLDLSGLIIHDLGRNAVLIPEGTTLSPNGVMVVGRELDVAVNCNTPVDLAYPEGFSLNDNIKVIDVDTPDGDEIFSELVAQGTIGTGIEMGLEGARLVFEPEYYADFNDSWLRDDANLSILFVSDENDVSPYPVDAYLRYFTDLKGDRAYRDRQVVNLSAVVGKDEPPVDDVPSCESASGFAGYGLRYIEAANATEGLVESICEEDFAPIITNLGLTLSGLGVEFALSETPDPDSLEVGLYREATTDSFERPLERGVDFQFICEGNLLRFAPDQVPPSEWYVTATYERLPTNVELPDEFCDDRGGSE